jgi:hypothetical protein
MAFAQLTKLHEALNRGARANLFEVEIDFPPGVSGNITDFSRRTKLLCKSAAIPGFTIGTIEVPYKAGRKIKVPGDRTFADWTVTIINDENHEMRRAFTTWVNTISKSNYNSPTKSSVTNYYKDIVVNQLKMDGTITRTYKLLWAFPTDVGALDLSFDTTDTLSEFTVNFQYHYLQAGPTAPTASTDDLVAQT